jgi:murein DD-endopeptidase MepM/ murein hydrolase activator NlpD
MDRLADVVHEEGENLRALERLISRASKALASLPSRWPVRGAVNSEFGGRRSPWAKGSEFHSGIDIGAERGTPVHAPAAGTVTFAGPHAEYGLTVIVDHGGDLRTIYGHLSKIGVTLGQKLARGAELGLTGNTGRSSGPHLHYEILVKDRPVNPRAYFWD